MGPVHLADATCPANTKIHILMKTYTLAAFVAVPCIVSVASAATFEEYSALFDEQISCASQMVQTLNSITDKASADAAAPVVAALAQQLVAVDVKLDALGDPSPEVAERIEAMLDERGEEIMGIIESMFNAGMNLAVNGYFGSDALRNVIENLAGDLDDDVDVLPLGDEDDEDDEDE